MAIVYQSAPRYRPNGKGKIKVTVVQFKVNTKRTTRSMNRSGESAGFGWERADHQVGSDWGPAQGGQCHQQILVYPGRRHLGSGQRSAAHPLPQLQVDYANAGLPGRQCQNS